MSRRRLIVALVVGGLLLALGVWISRHTYWADVTVPMPPTGEARTNPFYAAQRFTEALHARATRDRVLATPPRDGVIVLGSWRWSLSVPRRERLERWVEAGGRLVVAEGSALGDADFERWSGIVRDYREDDEDAEESEAESAESESADTESAKTESAKAESPKTESNAATDQATSMDALLQCRPYREEHAGGQLGTTTHTMCGVDAGFFLTTTKPVLWALRDGAMRQALRVRVGRGSVTVVNTSPFRHRELFDADHAWLFVAAAQLRRGDDIHFLSEDEHPSLFAYIWTHGGPVVVLSLAIVVGLLWRGGVRFGPLVAATVTARRSLAEQIRGTGQFALRHGGGEALHAAAVRALEEAARRRVRRFGELTDGDRAETLARLTGLNARALAASLHRSSARSQELRRAITRLETARRQILTEQNQRSSHGTS